MSVQLDIFTGGLNRLQSSGPAGIAVAWPGIAFEPPTGSGAIWLEAGLFPASNVNISWQAEAKTQFQGFLQVVVGFRNGEGIRPAMLIAEQIVTLYPKGIKLGPVKVSSRPSIGPPVAEDGKNLIAVSIPYFGIA